MTYHSFFISKNTYVDGDNIWLLTNEINTLCKFDISTMRLLSHYELPCEKIKQYGYYAFTKISDKLLVLPFCNEDMIIIDINNDSLTRVKVPYYSGDNDRYGKFHIIASCGEKAMMIGHNIRGIFFYDKNKLRVDMDYLQLFEENGFLEEGFTSLFSDCYIQVDERVYVPVANSSFIFVANVKDESYELINIGCDVKLRTIDLMDEEDKTFFLTTIEDEKVIWSQKRGLIERKKLNLLKGDEKYYMRAYFVKGTYVYISACERTIVIEKNGELKRLSLDHNYMGEFPNGWTQFEAIFVKDEKVYFQLRVDGTLFCLDTQECCIKRMEFDVLKDEVSLIVEKSYKYKEFESVIREKPYLRLDNYLHFI